MSRELQRMRRRLRHYRGMDAIYLKCRPPHWENSRNAIKYPMLGLALEVRRLTGYGWLPTKEQLYDNPRSR